MLLFLPAIHGVLNIYQAQGRISVHLHSHGQLRRVNEMDGIVDILQMKQLRLRTLQKYPMITQPGSGGAEVQIQVRV